MQLWYQCVDFFFFFNLTYSRRTPSLPSCLWSQRIFPSLPGSCLTFFLSRCKFCTFTTRQPMVEFYLLTFPRFPLRKKEHKPYFGKNRTHDFRTSRCAGYLLDHSGDENDLKLNTSRCPKTLTQLTLFQPVSHVVALKCLVVSPSRSRLSTPCCLESHNLLAYLMIRPNVAAEAGAGRDEASRVSARVYEIFVQTLLAEIAA